MVPAKKRDFPIMFINILLEKGLQADALGVVTTVYGFSEEFKHLVNPTHPHDKDFESKTLVDKAGQKTKMYSKTSKEQTQYQEEQQVEADAEFGDSDKERETSKINENKKNKWKLIQKLRSPCKLKGRNEEEEIRNKSIRRIKRKEKMKRMRKLRRNFKMKMADGYESPCNYDDTKGAPNDENEEEENSGGKRNATDDENDEEEISDTQQLTEVNILRENENTEKITPDEDTEKNDVIYSNIHYSKL
ncbi:unnamed protein product [Brassica rapa]|uniref:Uncharacterized protein n=1 Tax=Brassica campestris TaxID=3711 RepID=A0A8D9DG03_BRACM|nr:unnamed protein product [Brassica rapa]